MGVIARERSSPGGGQQIQTLAQVATPRIPVDGAIFNVTGTTGITGFDTTTPIIPGRVVVILGIHATGPAYTDTAIASTANGKIHLSGSLTQALGTSLTLFQNTNGSWIETARAANG